MFDVAYKLKLAWRMVVSIDKGTYLKPTFKQSKKVDSEDGD